MKKTIGACGASCTGCKIYQKECAGCSALEGKVPWMVYVNEKVCPIYDCCVNDRKYEHCNKCSEMPCKRFYQYKDPALSDEGNEKLNSLRIGTLRSL
ncbi:MAG: DUF3795 domain-containing protein [Candidatus Methanomethylophilaceae archaeon]